MSGIFYFLILLGVLVAVHEFGHFLVAKALGVKVLKFSIGFGPRLVGFTRGETEYRISLLPLGGYVKMAGELPYEELPPEEASRGFLAQPPWKRALIVVAGPAFNLIFPIIVFFFFFLGDSQGRAPTVGSVEPGMPAAEAGLKPGDRVTTIDGEKIETFEDLREVLKDRFDHPLPIDVLRGGQHVQVWVKPVAFTEDNHVEKVKHGYVGITNEKKSTSIGVAPGSVAEKAGLKGFDYVIAVNGQVVGDQPALFAALEAATGEVKLKVVRMGQVAVPGVMARLPETVEVTVPKQSGEGFAAIGADDPELYVGAVSPKSPAEAAGLKLGDRIVALNGKPVTSALRFGMEVSEFEDKPFELSWRSGGEAKSATIQQKLVDQKDEIGNKLKVYTVGFGLGPTPIGQMQTPELVKIHLGPVEAFRASAKRVPEFIRETVLVVGGLVTGRVPVQTVGGPIMMYSLAARTSEEGFGYFLTLLGAISVNLGVMNLLPIPILDGFALLSALWEAVRRRPIPVRAREVANLVGLAMLLILMIFVFKNDIGRVMEKDAPTEQR